MPTTPKKPRKPGGDPVHNDIIRHYQTLFFKRYGIAPEIPRGWIHKMLKDLLQRHSAGGLKRVIELYFEDKSRTSHHISSMLSAWAINTYLPKARLDPRVYANAEEYNKDIY